MSHLVPHDKTRTKEQSDSRWISEKPHHIWKHPGMRWERAVMCSSLNVVRPKLNVLLYQACCRDIHDLGDKLKHIISEFLYSSETHWYVSEIIQSNFLKVNKHFQRVGCCTREKARPIFFLKKALPLFHGIGKPLSMLTEFGNENSLRFAEIATASSWKWSKDDKEDTPWPFCVLSREMPTWVELLNFAMNKASMDITKMKHTALR